MVKSIFLQDGEEIFVDDEDYERVNQHTWYKFYTGNTRHIKKGDKKTTSLANFLVEGSTQKEKNNYFTKDNSVDLRYANRYQRARGQSVSKYKGVNFNKKDRKWWAQIYVDGKTKLLGRFSNEDDAALAYNRGVDEYFNSDGYKNKIGYDNRVPSRTYRTFDGQKTKHKGKTGYKGVTYSSKKLNYLSRISYKLNRYQIMYSKSKEQSALVYNKCALYLYGDDAILNDVPMTDELKEFISNWEIPDKIKALKEGADNE